MSVGSMKSKFEKSLGQIHYKIKYEEDTKTLTVIVVECKDLPKMDIMGKSDPFVRVYLLPNTHKELKTKVIKKTLNPIFNESFKFVVPLVDITKKTVVFQVFDWDKISKTDCIGEVQIPLWKLNLSVEADEWKTLHKQTGTKDKPALQSVRPSSTLPRGMNSSSSETPSLPVTSPPRRSRSRSSSDERKGRAPGPPSLVYELKYEHSNQVLVLTVIEARDLKTSDMMGKGADAVVSVYLLPGNHKELKTKVIKNQTSPVFNESFRFEMKLQDVLHRTLVLQVEDYDRFSKNDSLGEVQIPLSQIDFNKQNKECRVLQPVMTKKSPKKSRPSTEKRSSSSDDDTKSRKPGPSGPPALKYGIHYDHHSKSLVLRVIQCRDLGKADMLGGKPDSYVEVNLAPGNHKELKTRTIKNNANPDFNEEFKFDQPISEASQKTFVIRVWDYDMLSKNDALGEVVIPLWQVDLSQATEGWKDLQKMTARPKPPPPRKNSASSDDEKKKKSGSMGPPSLCYSLGYEQDSQTLVVTVLRVRDLKKADLMGGKADAIVHVTLGDKEFKTKVVKNNNNPEINETFRFPLPAGESHRTRSILYFQVWDWDRFSKNDPLGEVSVPLGQVDISSRSPQWAVIQPMVKKKAPTPAKKPALGPTRIRYQIQYNRNNQSLAVTVVQAENLAKADLLGGAADSYVCVYLLHGDFKVEKTKVVKNNASPTYNQNFVFRLPFEDVTSKTIVLQVFDSDTFSKDDPLGEVQIPLWLLDVFQVTDDWKQLHPFTGTKGKPGLKTQPPISQTSSSSLVTTNNRRSSSSSSDDEKKSHPPTGPPSLSYSLGYEEHSQTLVVTVLRARNLKNTDLMGGKADTVVHVCLEDQEMKTKVVKENNNPEINETFRLPLLAGDSQRTRSILYLKVWDWDRFSKNDPIGEVALPLGQVDISSRTPQWSVLQPMSNKKPPAPAKKPTPGPARIRSQVQYDGNNQSLSVTVVQSENLGKADVIGKAADSYVCVYLLQGKYKVEKTKVVKNNSSPTYNQNFIFRLPQSEVISKTIVLQVFDDDTFSKDDPLGEAQIPLWLLDVYQMNDEWRELHGFTGTKGKPLLKVQPPITQTSSLVTTTNNGRRSRSSSSSSSDGEKRGGRPSVHKPRSRSSSSSSNSSKTSITVVPQNLNLRQLNELLLKYIDQVRFLESRQDMEGHFTVNINRSEIDALHQQYSGQLADWRTRCEAAEAKWGEANVQVGSLQDLSREVSRLQGELERMRREMEEERKRNNGQNVHWRAEEQELRNRIAVLETELKQERGRGQVDISSIDSKLKGDYEKRLMAEVRSLRKMYEDQMKKAQEEWLRMHQTKLSELETALARERAQQSSSGVEARELRILVEELRRKTGELEESNRNLGMKSSQMSVQLQESNSMHQAQMASKDMEIEELKRRILEVQRQYEEIYGTKLEDLQEVKVYGGIIMPEIQRLTRHHEKREKERRKSRGRDLSSSSSSDDEKKKTIKGPFPGPCLSYSLGIEQASQTLLVTVHGARNLKNTDLLGGKADVLVHVILGGMEMKTKVVKENNNPDIGETFRFPLPMGESQRNLLFQVWDWDKFSKNDPIGEVFVPLGQSELMDRNAKWAVLKPITKRTDSASRGSTFL